MKSPLLRNEFAKAAGFVASVRHIASAGHSTHHGSRDGYFIKIKILQISYSFFKNVSLIKYEAS
ncbi:MAG TPA: hypothetical protein PKK66_05635 [Bacteroidales bacterium]|nr:hypothetical protein [Bacteroidales bacterium]MDD4395276.1 hypothetical protein [Bacteroidales bacterium]HNW68312.1 hypothetical protein [Bacteroidales bacterium]HPT52430.1 hypothetical protein [Bacteroidales bacterium]